MEERVIFENALTHLQSGDPQQAVALCDDGLNQFPGDGNLLCLSAQAFIAMREYAEARPRLEKAIQMYPDFALAHETMGDLLVVQGELKAARKAFQTAMRLEPTRELTRKKVEHARALEKKNAAGLKRMAASEAEMRKAAELQRNGEMRDAEMIYREILGRDPNHIDAAVELAGIAAKNQRFRDAEVFLKQVLKNAPDHLRAWADLTNAQRERDRFDDAIESAKQVLRLSPDEAKSHVLYATAVGSSGDHEAAIASYKKALSISPDKPDAICSMAHHQKTIGETEAAITSYRRAIEIQSDHAEAYWSLANLKTFRFSDAEVAAMHELLGEDSLPDESRAQLNNALGLEYEGQKDYDRAFDHFEACNAARRPLETYDPVDTETTYARLIDLFTPAFMTSNAGVDAFPVTPIFIVGLPRSGSTLVEQILASHSQVDGTHELGDLPRAVQAKRREKRSRDRFPEALADNSINDWRDIGSDYLQRTEIYRQGAPYFIDKNPNNFIYAAILKLAIPNAKIINARRHPLDSCFGSFKQLFASGQPFSYDMTEIGEYYLQYQHLMDHWHELMPGFVLDVQYEKNVADLETEVRRILDFCELPFEQACLEFHKTERAVKTASSEQVRRPIYSSSVNLWRNYEHKLEELVHILKPLLEQLPEADRPA